MSIVGSLIDFVALGKLNEAKQEIRKLTQAKISLDLEDKREQSPHFGKSALMVAASLGKFIMVQELLQAKAYINLVTNAGKTALLCAVEAKQVDTVKALCEKGAIVDDPAVYLKQENPALQAQTEYQEFKKTPLFLALVLAKTEPKKGFDLLKILCDTKTVNEAKDKETPRIQAHSLELAMLFAVDFQLPEIIEFLIKKGVSPAKLHYHCEFDRQRFPILNVADKTAVLAHAVAEGNLNVVRLLILEDKEFATKTDAENRLVIEIAINRGNVEMIKELRRAGANLSPVNPLNSKKVNLVSQALQHPNITVSVPLLKALCDPLKEEKTSAYKDRKPTSPPPEDLTTALFSAVKTFNPTVVQYLVEQKANVNFKDKDGNALALAIKESYPKHSATPEAIKNRTAVVKALFSGSEKPKPQTTHWGCSECSGTERVHTAHSQLFIAIEKEINDDAADIVEELLKYKPFQDLISETDHHKRTMFHRVAHKGNVKTLQALLKHPDKSAVKSLLETEDESHATPLYVAVQKGDTAVVKELLNAKAYPNHRCENKEAPLALHAAIKFSKSPAGAESITRLLRMHGAEADAQTFELIFAAKKALQAQNESATKSLLEDKTEEVFLPLLHAVCQPEAPSLNEAKQNEVKKEVGAKTQVLPIATKTLQEALLSAAKRNLSKFVTYLIQILKLRSDLDVELLKQAFAAAHEHGKVENIEVFLQPEFRINKGQYPFLEIDIPDFHKWGVVHKPVTCAVYRSHNNLAGKLLAAGATVEQQDSMGRTALHIVAQSPYLKHIEEILKYTQGKVDFEDKQGRTPLFDAVENSQDQKEEKSRTDVTTKLLEQKANVNHRDKEGNTPLRLAFEAIQKLTDQKEIHTEVISLLLKSGAKVSPTNLPNKHTLLQILIENVLVRTSWKPSDEIFEIADRLTPHTDLNQAPKGEHAKYVQINGEPAKTLLGFFAAHPHPWAINFAICLIKASRGCVGKQAITEVLMVCFTSAYNYGEQLKQTLNLVMDAALIKEVSKKANVTGDTKLAVETRLKELPGELSKAASEREAKLKQEEKDTRSRIEKRQQQIKNPKIQKDTTRTSQVSSYLQQLMQPIKSLDQVESKDKEKPAAKDEIKFSERELIDAIAEPTKKIGDTEKTNKAFLIEVITKTNPKELQSQRAHTLRELLIFAVSQDLLTEEFKLEESLSLKLWAKLETACTFDVFFTQPEHRFIRELLKLKITDKNLPLVEALIQKCLMLAPKTFLDIANTFHKEINPKVHVVLEKQKKNFAERNTLLDVHFYLKQKIENGYGRSLDCPKEKIQAQREQSFFEIAKFLSGIDLASRNSGTWPVDVLDVIAICAKITRGKNLLGRSYVFSDMLRALLIPKQDLPAYSTTEYMESKDADPKFVSRREHIIMDLKRQWFQLLTFLESRFPNEHQTLMGELAAIYPSSALQQTPVHAPVLKPAQLRRDSKTSNGPTNTVNGQPEVQVATNTRQ